MTTNLTGLNLKNLPVSESIKRVQTTIELATKDVRKYIEYLEQLDELASSGLNFQQVQERKTRLIYDLKRLAERTADNQETITRLILEDMHRQTVDLEQVVGEMPSQIDARFVFYNFDLSNEIALQVKDQFEVDSFNQLVNLVRMPKWKYAYFHLKFGQLHLLVCQYVSATKQLPELSIPVATYADPANGFWESIQHRWGKPLSIIREVIHLFTPVVKQLDMGVALQTEDRKVQAYQPHASDQVNQLTKIIYDFINMYGISNCHVVHLFRQRNRSLIFLAPTLIEPSNGRLIFPAQLTNPTQAKTNLTQPQIFLA